MKAVKFPRTGSINAPGAFVDVTMDAPSPEGRDLLVRVRAVSVNPVDTKARSGLIEAAGGSGVAGWDAAGVVEAVGPEASLFKPGDAVWYAGAIERPGSNAELQLVDERIVGPKPQSLDFAAAAALPLTSLTAWEMLFDRFGLREGDGAGQSMLIIGAAGGVGSIALQLARRLTKFTLVGTASRPETADWARRLGAQHVIDHRQPIVPAWRELGLAPPTHVFVTNGENEHFPAAVEVVAPQGRLGFIVAPANADLSLLLFKSLSLHVEFMYTRHLFQTHDIAAQHEILKRVATLVDEGAIVSTQAEHFGVINAANLAKAHRLIESGAAKGKIVLEGF